MIKPSIALDFADPSKVPLALQFSEVFEVSYKGIQDGARTATVKYLEENFEGPFAEPEMTPDGPQLALSILSRNGSGFSTTLQLLNDGAVGFSCAFIATSKEALVALIDAASAALTEMDAKVLSEGLYKP